MISRGEEIAYATFLIKQNGILSGVSERELGQDNRKLRILSRVNQTLSVILGKTASVETQVEISTAPSIA